MTRPLVIKEMTNDQTEHRSSDEAREAAVRILHNVLKEAVRRRVESIHGATQSDAPALALLYSGGLDSAVLAALTDLVYPSHQPIELLTVAFANPRKLASARSKCVTEGHQAESSATFDTPDRLTARRGVQELREINPQRQWRLIEINVEAQEYEDHKQEVMHLMYPSSSVMDLSIAAALYFASRGVGYLPSDGSESPTAPSAARTRYISHARVLLSGLGADEQLGGYSRHKAAWQRGGEAELAKEVRRHVKESDLAI
ncbi:Asparagine synthase [Ceraceosorus bombacis]|uniref:Asparagine synthase n=1 Tax=Ceraceosorus bombacis TaxID=401625 RepID=A0A0P1BDS1_9BASI|nr:Asparagine synthase [Ceraceosorus bombacis]